MRRESVLKFGLTFGKRNSLSITHQHTTVIVVQLLQGLKTLATKFKLKIFVGVKVNRMFSEALGFLKSRGRPLILLPSYHVGYVSLHFLRLPV